MKFTADEEDEYNPLLSFTLAILMDLNFWRHFHDQNINFYPYQKSPVPVLQNAINLATLSVTKGRGEAGVDFCVISVRVH
jgi:hypothetical protein